MIAYIVAGIFLLFFGRKLFWLFVAAVGFLIGIMYIPELLPGQSQNVILVVALIAGLLGALLAVLLQKFAVGMAGLAVGGYVTYYLLQIITLDIGNYQWLAILAGALLGAVLAGSMVDWALILVSSTAGAVAISQNVPIGMPFNAILLLALLIVGIIAQVRMKINE